MCKQLMQTNDIQVRSIIEDDITDHVDVSHTSVQAIVSGWARRGTIVTEDNSANLKKYQPALQEMFDLGKSNKALKMSSANMRQRLYQQFGEQFDVPTEAQIQKAINAMFARQKHSAVGGGNARDIASSTGMAPVYKAFIDDLLVESNFSVAPRVAVSRIREKFQTTDGYPSDFPTEGQVKNRVSGQKTKHRKENYLPDDCMQ